MSDVGILILLYCLGVLILVAEIFIPSHGILSVAGLGFLIAAVVRTFSYGGREAGVIAIFACVVFVPSFAFFAIKYWPMTPIGRKIAPPNPKLSAADTSLPVEELASLVGKCGKSVSPLRPVGICDFDGQRVSCVCEMGMLEAGVVVEGIGIKGGNLAVAEKKV
ncbi:MAG: hypothetical protein JSU63_04790 [Phycisphaerales bacterium]|nr:MAG: hypothetical protein JSU63_04790 [Phycisphaerales bacterium]